MMNPSVLSANNIRLNFGNHTVLDGINIEIKAGEVTALLGPNGAGKSSLLKLLCGEIATKNRIVLFGRDKTDWQTTDLAKKLGILPQHSTLSFPFLAHEVVELGAIPLNIPKQETQRLARKYMEMTDVAHLANRLYPSLSGGEKQRLHLARVLVQLDQAGDEKILMLDEPTSALDLAHQHNTLKIARQLADDENTAVVVVLHDLNLAAQYADRMVVLHKGRLVCDASPWKALTPELIKTVYGYHSLVSKHPSMNFPVVYPAA